jgi:hypothetical protein
MLTCNKVPYKRAPLSSAHSQHQLLLHCCHAVQVVDLDNLALAVQCTSMPANATAQELADAERVAKNGPQNTLSSDGSGLSSRPASVNKIWLDFAGSTITGTGEQQQKQQQRQQRQQQQRQQLWRQQQGAE